MINQITLDGIIVSEISLRTSNKKGTPVADFRVCNRERRAKNPVFIDVEVWGRQAEIVKLNAGRNSKIVISGELRMDSWESRDTGEKRSKHKITADSIVFVDGRKLEVPEEDSHNEFSV